MDKNLVIVSEVIMKIFCHAINGEIETSLHKTIGKSFDSKSTFM